MVEKGPPPNFSVSSLTNRQEALIALLPLGSCLLSIFGSSVIIYQVAFRSTRRKRTPYKRLLFGLSVCDIIATLCYGFQSFAVPADSSRRLWAMGNDMSCSVLGLFSQLAFSAIWYNGFLSYYYVLTIRYGVDAATFAKRYEPIMHFLAIGFNLLTGISGFIFHHYGEGLVGPGCWCVSRCLVHNGKEYCTEWPNGWIFGAVPTLFFFLSIIVNNCMIYSHIRKKARVGGGGQRRSTTTNTDGSKLSPQDDPTNNVNVIATQAFGYVATFFVSYTSAICVKAIESFGGQTEVEASIFPLLVLQAIFLPLQGFFNAVVYCRPSYIKHRTRFPEQTKLWACRNALLGIELNALPRGNSSRFNGKINPSTRTSQTSRTSGDLDGSSFFEYNHSSLQKNLSGKGFPKFSSTLNSIEEEGWQEERSHKPTVDVEMSSKTRSRCRLPSDMFSEELEDDNIIYEMKEEEEKDELCSVADDDDDVTRETEQEDSDLRIVGRHKNIYGRTPKTVQALIAPTNSEIETIDEGQGNMGNTSEGEERTPADSQFDNHRVLRQPEGKSGQTQVQYEPSVTPVNSEAEIVRMDSHTARRGVVPTRSSTPADYEAKIRRIQGRVKSRDRQTPIREKASTKPRNSVDSKSERPSTRHHNTEDGQTPPKKSSSAKQRPTQTPKVASRQRTGRRKSRHKSGPQKCTGITIPMTPANSEWDGRTQNQDGTLPGILAPVNSEADDSAE